MARLNAVLCARMLVLSAFGGAACARVPKEGPPQAEGQEIASAAPRALGALAAGGESAPTGWRAPSGPNLPDDSDEDEDDEDDDGGAPAGRDAGRTAPEDLPL